MLGRIASVGWVETQLSGCFMVCWVCNPTYACCPIGGRKKTAPEYYGGTISETKFLNHAEKWLGSHYRSLPNGRYLSDDGMRQIRYGNHETTTPNHHHGHFEAYDRPADQGGTVIENTFVTIEPD